MIRKTHFLAGAAPSCLMISIGFDTEGGEGGGGSGTPSSDSGQDGGNELTTEQKLEREFDNTGTPGEDSDSDDGSESDDNDDEPDGDDEDGDGADEGGDADDNADDGEGGEGEGGNGEEGSKGGAADKERIQELTTRAERAEAELAQAREAAEKAGISLDSVADEAITLPEEPDPSKYKYGEHDKDYIKDQAKYEAKMDVLREQAEGRFKVEAASLEAKWTKNLVGAHERYPDYDDVVVKGAADKKWPCPPVVALAIKDSDYGPDVAYELASNPEEAKRISKLSPLEQAREFGRMEERQYHKAEEAKRKAEKDAERKAKEEQPRHISRAPEPPKRQIRGGGGHSRRNLADIDDFAEFEKAADAKLKNGPRQRARVS